MTSIEALAKELENEAKTTRRFLERVPFDRADWRPHPKSMPMAELATHLVSCIGWTESIFSGDGLDFDPATSRLAPAASSGALLAMLDERVERGLAALRAASDADLDRPWRFSYRGKLYFERPKGRVLRDFALSHLIHHRGQLSVYLRLLDVPVPGAYGPSGDEKG
jgi:uncharacterized damage-inducible protein DinB